MAKRKKMSKAGRKRVSELMKARWVAARKEGKTNLGPRKKRKKVEVTPEPSENKNFFLGKVKFTVYSNNPNTGAIELEREGFAESFHDLLSSVVDVMYSGNVIKEIRMESL